MPAKAARLDLDGEMAFAAAVVAGMAAMLRAVVDHGELRRERGRRAGVCSISAATGPVKACGHRAYIGRLARKGVSVGERGQEAGAVSRPGRRAGAALRPARLRRARRIPRARPAQRPGFDGPGDWRWLCLDHVREFNAGYNYFDGMSARRDQRRAESLWRLGPRDPRLRHRRASPAAALGRFRRSARRDRRALPRARRRARARTAAS